MPESSELTELPLPSPLRKLCNESIDLIKRLDPLIANLAKERGYAELRIQVKRGEPGRLQVIRDFDLSI